MASIFTKIHAQAERAGIKLRTVKSRNWFLKKIRSMTRITPSRILKDEMLKTRNRPLIGRMFMFLYDPKGKDTLPYYDRFPLILMVGPAKKGFYGLNLHYLPPRQRAIFFDRLMDFTNNNRYNHTTRFQLTYNLLNSVQQLRAFAPCFKHYLFDHVTSKAVEVAPSEWEIALFLPTDSFVKETREKIWKTTRNLV